MRKCKLLALTIFTTCMMTTVVKAEGLTTFESEMGKTVSKSAYSNSIDPPAKFPILYDLKGGHADNPETYTKYSEFKLKKPKKKGYVFIGWTGTNLSKMKKKVRIKKGSAGVKRYIANWAKETYKVKFNTKCDDKNIEPMTVEYKQEFTLPTLSPNGKYVFDGWTDGKNVYEGGETVSRLTTNGKIKLKARWKEGVNLGVWRVTAYEPTGITASGVPVTPHRSVAMAQNAIAKYGLEFGDLIYLPSSGETLVLEDWGDSLMAARCEWIDVCVNWDEMYSGPYNTETEIYLVS